MSLQMLALVITVAFVPSLAYMVIVRNTERYQREPWRAVMKSFLWGATFAILISLIVEILLTYFYTQSLELFRGYEFIANHKESIDAIMLAGVIAPLVEEAAKSYGIITSKAYIDEVEDGFVYGASSGFGFAATENLLYEISALLSGGVVAWAIVAFVRSIASALLHGSATAMTGYGYSSNKVAGKGSILHGYGVAVLMHSSFNIIASVPIFLAGFKNPLVYAVPLLIAIIYGTLAFKYIRERIRYYDRHPPRR